MGHQMRVAGSATIFTLALSILGSAPRSFAQGTAQDRAAETVRSAKTVFVVNGGSNDNFLNVIPGDANTCYNEFFTSLAGSRRFRMLDDPAAADLILVIRCSQAVDYERSASRNRLWDEVDDAPLVSLAVFTPGTQQPLYAITQPAGRGSNIPKGKVAFANSINALTAKLLELGSSPPALPSPDALLAGAGPVPARIPAAKRLYVTADRKNSAVDPTSTLAPFSAALKATDRYSLVSTSQDADLVLNVSFDTVMVVRICEPGTQQLLWTLSDPSRNIDPKGNKGHLNREVAGMAAAFEALGKQKGKAATDDVHGQN